LIISIQGMEIIAGNRVEQVGDFSYEVRDRNGMVVYDVVNSYKALKELVSDVKGETRGFVYTEVVGVFYVKKDKELVL